jgi:two-component system sensor histidine kinase RegB
MSDNLRRLCLVRLVLLSAMVVALGFAYLYQLDVPYTALGLILLLLIGLNIVSWFRSHREWPVTEFEFLLQILADILGLSLILYFSGGATNPFISYFLVPLSIAAATLPWRFTWIVALLCIGIYSALLVYNQPLEALAPHHHDSGRPSLHVIGMWANFTVSALLITYFVVRMAQALREREQLLNQLREEDLRDEQIMAVATLAAGTAHELGTPLSTMKILLEELHQESTDNQTLRNDLDILASQVEICRSTLKKLVATADRNRQGVDTLYQAGEYFRELTRDWHLLHPATTLALAISPQLDQLQLSGDATLKQALINLLDNASAASPDAISVDIGTDDDCIVLEILDDGPGLANDIADQVGKPIIINSESGLGIGLLLTHATLTRFGGNVTLYRREPKGTRTRATLPVRRIKIPHD